MATNWSEKAEESTYTFKENGDLEIMNAAVIQNFGRLSPNFEGDPRKCYDPKNADRSFNIALSQEMADRLVADGWNVSELPPNDSNPNSLYFVNIKLDPHGTFRPVQIDFWDELNSRLIPVPEEAFRDLDDMEVENWDVNIGLHRLENSKYRIKGWANRIIVTRAASNMFGGKYASKPADIEEMPFN